MVSVGSDSDLVHLHVPSTSIISRTHDMGYAVVVLRGALTVVWGWCASAPIQPTDIQPRVRLCVVHFVVEGVPSEPGLAG